MASTLDRHRKRIEGRYLAGHSTGDIARDYGVTPPTVVNALNRWGAPLTRVAAHREKQTRKKLRQMLERGYTLAKAAHRLGLTAPEARAIL